MTEPQSVLDGRSIALRRQIIETLKAGNRGHLGSALSLVEILRVLYDDVLRYDARNPKWPDRDRFVLSKGHGCLALYVVLADHGFFPKSELTRFCGADGLSVRSVVSTSASRGMPAARAASALQSSSVAANGTNRSPRNRSRADTPGASGGSASSRARRAWTLSRMASMEKQASDAGPTDWASFRRASALSAIRKSSA